MRLFRGINDRMGLFLGIGMILIASVQRVQPHQQVPEKPKNIILMIGDGMGLSHISALYAVEKESVFDQFTSIGMVKTHARDALITDSAASATAIATGVKTFNRAIGVGPDTVAVPSIVDYVADRGGSTGIVTTASIVHATPAAFYAHQPSRAFTEFIAKDVATCKVDFFIGGGRQYFDENRSDGQSIYPELESSGYAVYDYTTYRLNALPVGRSQKIIYFTDEAEPKLSLLGHFHLTDAANKALRFFKKRKTSGFFLLLEGAQIDWSAHANDGVTLMKRLRSFEEAVKSMLNYVKKNPDTLLIVTADHETGGLVLGENVEKQDPNIRFTSKNHTSVLVPVFAYGPGSERFTGLFDNTALYDKMVGLLDGSESYPTD